MPKTSFADFPDIVMSGDRTVQADPKFAGLKVGVLALQGAFAEHCDSFRRLGVREVRPREGDSRTGRRQNCVISIPTIARTRSYSLVNRSAPTRQPRGSG